MHPDFQKMPSWVLTKQEGVVWVQQGGVLVCQNRAQRQWRGEHLHQEEKLVPQAAVKQVELVGPGVPWGEDHWYSLMKVDH